MRKVRIEAGNVYSKIETGLADSTIAELYDACSYKQEVYKPSSYGKVEQTFSVFNKYTKTFPSGLLPRVSGVLDELGYGLDVRENSPRPSINIDKIFKKLEDFDIKLRDYQIDGAVAGIENNRGLFDWCTGSGKTVMFSFLLLAHDDVSLILVNRKELMEQIASEISSMTGRTVGLIGDGHWSPSKWTVAIVDTLRKGLSSESRGVRHRSESFLKKIKMFVGDEVHHLGAESWMGVSQACVNASLRYGFSGTCVRPDSEDVHLISHTGRIISHVKSNDLVKAGWLGRPRIYMPTVEQSGSFSGWQAVKKNVVCSDAIIESGCKFIMSMYNKGLSVMYFAGNDLQFGRRIHNALTDMSVSPRDLRFMSGTEDRMVRRKVLEDYRNKRLQILGGTSIYDEGIDVPHTDAGANFGQGFSMISTIQRLGRCLRKSKDPKTGEVVREDKQTKYYWDPMNIGHDITEKHSQFRKSLYEENDSYKVFGRPYGKK